MTGVHPAMLVEEGEWVRGGSGNESGDSTPGDVVLGDDEKGGDKGRRREKGTLRGGGLKIQEGRNSGGGGVQGG